MDVLSTKMEAFPIKDVPLALVFGLLTVVAVVYRLVQASDKPVLDHIPILGKGDVKERRNEFAKHGLDLLKEGYEKVGLAVLHFSSLKWNKETNHGRTNSSRGPGKSSSWSPVKVRSISEPG